MFKNLSPEALGIAGRQSEVIELALSFGFKGIDLDIVEFTTAVKEKGIAHARRLIDSAKLKLGSFRLPVDLESADADFNAGLDQISAWAVAAAELGCLRARVVIEPSSDGRPYHQNFDFHRQRLAELARRLAAHGVQLGVGFRAEPSARQSRAFEFVHDLSALMMLLSTLGAKNVGVSIDSWQLFVSGAQLDELRKVGAARIVEVGLADVPAEQSMDSLTSAHRLAPGETGVVPNKELLVMLAELGYKGPVTPRPAPRAHQGQKREAVARAVGAKLDELWKSAGLGPAPKLAAAQR